MKILRKFLNVRHTAALSPVMIVILVSCVVYFNALSNQFVYDDVFQVTENQWITDVRYIPDIFTKSVWGFQAWASSSNYYRPMMHLMYMMSYYIFGLKPWGFHLVNVIFHTVNSILVFIITAGLFGKSSIVPEKGGGTTPLHGPQFTVHSSLLSPAFIAALLFAVHPIHTEAVTWVAGLPEVSFTFFSLLSFILYIRAKAGYGSAYIFSVLFFFLATLCKETALTLLIIFAAYEYVSIEERLKVPGRWKRFIPYGAAVGIYFIMRLQALGGLAPERKHTYLSAYQYIVNVFPLFSQYLQKLILPLNLNAFYVFHPVFSAFEMRSLLSFAVAGAFIILAVVAFRNSRVAFLSLVLITAPLLPVLYIPGLGENTFAERYLYFPSAGFVILTGMLFAWAKGRMPKWIPLLAATFLIIAGFYSIATVSRNTVWKNDLALYSDTAKKSPDGFIPNNNLGYALMKTGRMDEAKRQLETALRLKPDLMAILINQSVLYLQKGLTDKAMLELNNVLFLDPGRADAHHYLGLTYAMKGWLNQAVYEYTTVLRLKPDYPHIHSNLAECYAMQGRINEAMTEYEAALKSDPSDAQSANNLGILHLRAGHLDKAIELFQSSVKLRPEDPAFRKNLDDALYMRSAL